MAAASELTELVADADRLGGGKSNVRFLYSLGGMRVVRSLLCVAAAGLL